MFECTTCGYQTKRSFNFNLHNSRKTPCKPKVNTENVHNGNQNVHDNYNHVHNSKQNVHDNYNLVHNSNQNVHDDKACVKCGKCFPTNQNLDRHSKICTGVDKLTCPICFKAFNTRSAKSQHKKNVKCNPVVTSGTPKESLQEANQRLMKENEMLKSRPMTINNTTINNDNSTNNLNSNNTTNIQMNNYDKPYTDHITNEVMKRIFETSQQDPALIINETVRCIYKNNKHPENHVIKIGEKTALSKVFKDGKEIWLPMDGVIQTVLSNTGDFCADRLRDCHEEGDIQGTRVVVVWKLLEVLGTDDRDEDCLNRSTYIQSIKSAFL
jgi:hypothetical protein